MAVTPLQLPMSSNPGRYGADGAARLVNCYPEFRGKEGKVAYPLYASDGLRLFSTLSGGGRCRGMLTVGSSLWVVSGRLLFRVDPGGAATVIGGVPGDGPCYLAQNQAAPIPQIALVTDGLRFMINSAALGAIPDTDLVAPNSVVFLNQRFVYTAATGRFQWSALSDGDSYAPLDFATAEYGPDGLVRAFVRRGELLLIGDRTIEPWYAPQEGEDTFARSGTVIERGCANGATVAMVEETVILVADDLTVRALEGYQARRISNHAVERSIRDTSTRDHMLAWAYAKDGHSFYVLQGDDFSWTFDSSTGEWHQRESYGLNRWRAQFHAEFAGKHIVGDYQSGLLYEIAADAFDENGASMVMKVALPAHAYPHAIELNSLYLDILPGQGLNSSDEHIADPRAMIRVSKDNGKSYGAQRSRSVGRIGEHRTQVKANGFGTSREDGFVIEVSMSAGVARGITGAAADLAVVSR